jgi:CHAT domain-containing protein
MNPFTVSDLTALNVSHGHFAFLSACHSGRSTNFRLLSESIDLSSAIQRAGYPSVIGTLWQVSAEDSAEVAKDIYAGMWEGDKLEYERYAEMLHHAVKRPRDQTRIPRGGFRKQVEDNPKRWAAFIHKGV